MLCCQSICAGKRGDRVWSVIYAPKMKPFNFYFKVVQVIFKYCGNLEFKNKSIKNIRKLVEVEPRLIKEIYDFLSN
mgnify:CR=1 FL=1